MDRIITSDVVVAASQCPRKAFLLLRGEPGHQPHEYVQIISRRAVASRCAHATARTGAKGSAGESRPGEAARDLLTKTPLNQGSLSAECDGIFLAPPGPGGGPHLRQPEIATGTYLVTDEDTLRLAFAGYDLAPIARRLSNVNSLIFGRVYFPVRSNSLKVVASYAGARWTQPNSSGLTSLVWRYRWEESGDPAYRQMLTTYNQEDCAALHHVLRELRGLAEAGASRADADFIEKPKQFASEVAGQLHATFEAILRSAHEEYDRRKISVPKPGGAGPPKRGAPKGHKAYRRVKPTRAGTLVRVRPKQRCPRHKGQSLDVLEEQTEHTVTDLRFTKSGCRKAVTMYAGRKAYCPRCKVTYSPPAIRRFDGRVFGHSLQAWVLYQRMSLRLPYRLIIQELDALFGVGLSAGTVIGFLGYLSRYYEPTEKMLLDRMLNGPVIHADETRLNIQGEDQYVWVITDGRHVVFRLTDTREALLVRELLKDYKGVLVSDFYAGYDALPCRQQKCLVHLIRDLNDDLWANPHDLDLESFVQAFKELVVPILGDSQRYGAKRRHLAKFTSTVERFYRDHVGKTEYRSEVAQKYQKRFIRYKDDLFRFLTEDGIPWNNNMAERAIRHLAIQRKISGCFYKRVAAQYLRMLGIAQTCRFQSKSFLHFLLSGEKDLDGFVDRKKRAYSELVGSAAGKDTTPDCTAQHSSAEQSTIPPPGAAESRTARR